MQIPQRVQKRFIIIVSTWTTAAAYFLVGPSQLLGLPNTVTTTAIGLGCVGVFNPALLIAAMPELNKVAVDQYEDHYEENPALKQHVSNLAAGILNSVLSMGQLLSPIYGTIVQAKLGFRWTCDIVSLFTLLFGGVYLFYGSGWEAFVDPCSKIDKKDEYKKLVDEEEDKKQGTSNAMN